PAVGPAIRRTGAPSSARAAGEVKSGLLVASSGPRHWGRALWALEFLVEAPDMKRGARADQGRRSRPRTRTPRTTTMPVTPDRDAVLEALDRVTDPESGLGLHRAGLVKGLALGPG